MIDPIEDAIIDVQVGLGRRQGVSEGYDALVERGILDLIARVRQAQLDALTALLERHGISLTEAIIARFDEDTGNVCTNWHVRRFLHGLCAPRLPNILD